MAGDNDLSASLPDPPPPRPVARDAAIEAAMRRFDGQGATPPYPAATPRPAPRRLGRPQIGALATIALVATIGLPVWMSTSDRYATSDRPVQAPVPTPSQTNSAPTTARPALSAPPATPVEEPATRVAPIPDLPVAAKPTESSADRAEVEAAPPSQSFQAEQAKGAIVMTARRAAADPVPPPPPPPPAAPAPQAVAAAPPAAPLARMAEARADEADNIVVTGSAIRSSVSARRARTVSQRGDWNACTINDPGRSLAACKRLVDPAASGAIGRAAAHVADGLTLAWRGDTNGAIAAFDQAVGIAPKLGIAWLNRGLAQQRRGDLDQAIADLDKAVRYAPGTARAYYNRSLLYRQRGDTRRAEADEGRALELDDRYGDVIAGSSR